MSVYVTINALRKYLRDRGCMEERVLQSSGNDRIHIELRCRMKSGRSCRVVLGADKSGGPIPSSLLAVVERSLAPCLGRNWAARIPSEDPFG